MIVCIRISNFLSLNNAQYDYQLVFRKFYSTILALIDVIDCILEYLDDRYCGVFICIDLQKAFDTVNHEILCKKLDCCGI